MDLLNKTSINAQAVSLLKAFGFNEAGKGVTEEFAGYAEQNFQFFSGRNDIRSTIVTHSSGVTHISLGLTCNGSYDIAFLTFTEGGPERQELEVTLRRFVDTASALAYA